MKKWGAEKSFPVLGILVEVSGNKKQELITMATTSAPPNIPPPPAFAQLRNALYTSRTACALGGATRRTDGFSNPESALRVGAIYSTTSGTARAGQKKRKELTLSKDK